MTTTPFTQEDIIAKLYRDLTRLAGEIAIDRCRNRVMMTLLKDRLGVSEEELDTLFRAEVGEHLEKFCHDITDPMLTELDEPKPQGCKFQAG